MKVERLLKRLRANADHAIAREAADKAVSTFALAASARSAEEALAAVSDALEALELAEIMLTVYGAEGRRLERIRAALRRAEAAA